MWLRFYFLPGFIKVNAKNRGHTKLVIRTYEKLGHAELISASASAGTDPETEPRSSQHVQDDPVFCI